MPLISSMDYKDPGTDVLDELVSVTETYPACIKYRHNNRHDDCGRLMEEEEELYHAFSLESTFVQTLTIAGQPSLGAFLRRYACDKAKAHLAFQVYLNLAEVRGWRDVDLQYCEELMAPFVTGRTTLSADLEAVLPLAMEESISHQQTQHLFSSLRVSEETFNRVILAFCASDSSIVYYKVTNDVVKPEPPEVSDARKTEWQQRAAKRKMRVADCIESFHQQQENQDSS